MRHDFSATITGFSDPFTVQRRQPGKVVRGRYQRSKVTEKFTACGSMQPLAPRDLERLPEGTRANEGKKLYTECPLRVSEVPNPGQPGEIHEESDHVLWQGEEYEVRAVDDWTAQAGYFKYFLIKAGQ